MTAQTLFEMFDRANKKMKFPHILFQIPGRDFKLKLYVAGVRSKFPNTIVFASNHAYPDGRYFGRLTRENEFIPSVNLDRHTDLKTIIPNIIANPINELKMNGIQFNHCCFCGSVLLNASSVQHGYGPICAANYGLPWGDVQDEIPANVDFSKIGEIV